MRLEQDSLGTMEIPSNAYFGIHAKRATQNFPNHELFSLDWYKAVGLIKKVYYLAWEEFRKESKLKYPTTTLHCRDINPNFIAALIQSSEEVWSGKWFDQFIVGGITGGAGTSINMNINEIITNRALDLLGLPLGDYQSIHPLDHANIFQSTNDVIPSALKIAAMEKLKELSYAVDSTKQNIETLEKSFSNRIRIAYTQMQEAVPSTWGRFFSNYADAFARDWWRISKCEERIKTINLGGSAIGTGLTVPRFIIMRIFEILKGLTNLPLNRSENLCDTTSNLDSLVEVHAILKAHTVNLEKLASDLRLSSSDLFKHPAFQVLPVQEGSSIMPGKYNPVISEYIISICHKIRSNDQLITSLAGLGVLDLNPYLPIIGHALLDSISLLINANLSLNDNLLNNIQKLQDLNQYLNSPVIATALIPHIGHTLAHKLVTYMKDHKTDVIKANEVLQVLSPAVLDDLLTPAKLTSLGFTLKELRGGKC